MSFDPSLAAIRFGEGLSPSLPPPASPEALLEQVTGPDAAAERFAVTPFSQLSDEFAEIGRLFKLFRANRDSDDPSFRANYRAKLRQVNRAGYHSIGPLLARSVAGPQPFRERLMRFWADHFTAVGMRGAARFAQPAYVEEAIRPHIAAPFAQMLKAAVTHPLMLRYLDQERSVGPNAPARRGRQGLNENLAREVLELHTLGVGAAYSQADVRALAELFTGLGVGDGERFVFRPNRAEPGAETVLGQSYGGDPATLEAIHDALNDLALHPATAAHLARKLAVHFTSDSPDADLIATLESRYRETGGNLAEVYAALIAHPASWESFGQKVKQPMDFIASALRALDVPPRLLVEAKRQDLRSYITGPLATMGQNWQRPLGPDGWPEEAEAWITPQGLAARLQWAMAVPSTFYRSLPDPREFVTEALGPLATGAVEFAAANAETRRDGIGLILASPAFQRR